MGIWPIGTSQPITHDAKEGNIAGQGHGKDVNEKSNKVNNT